MVEKRKLSHGFDLRQPVRPITFGKKARTNGIRGELPEFLTREVRVCVGEEKLVGEV